MTCTFWGDPPFFFQAVAAGSDFVCVCAADSCLKKEVLTSRKCSFGVICSAQERTNAYLCDGLELLRSYLNSVFDVCFRLSDNFNFLLG